jgi:hypothetical protein
MKTNEILFKLLRPADPKEKNLQDWEDFLNTVDENILWYPSAWDDFNDLLYKYSELGPTAPSLFIHTDYFPGENLYDFILIENSQMQRDQDRPIFKNNKTIELLPVTGIVNKIQYDKIDLYLAVLLASANNQNDILRQLQNNFPPPPQDGIGAIFQPITFPQLIQKGTNPNMQLVNRIFLMEIYINQSFTKNVIYFFYDSICFLEKIIIQSGIKISNIWTKH